MTDVDKKLRWQQIQGTFEQALNLPPAERETWLTQSPLDADMLTEVRDMLAAHEGPALALEQGFIADQTPESIGPYKILECIGQGGMGEVFLACRSDGSFDRQVAIKTLSNWLSAPEVRTRFLQERRIHARLEHPNITRLLDAGVTEQGLPYLVTDYVHGTTIVEYAERCGCTPRQRVKLLLAACEAVAFAHSRLVLHRDIKPSNILVDDDGQVRLLDFGIAKLLDDENEDPAGVSTVTRPGEQLMTLRYASPEQIRGEPLDVTCDVYALGVVLFELLTGATPFDGSSQWQLSEMIIRQSPKFEGRTGPGADLDVDLKAICLKAMEKSSSQRYAGASALADDLRRYLQYRTIAARRPGWFTRFRRLFRRHPLAAPLTVLAIVAILSGGLTATWQANRAQLERDQARAQRDRAEQVTQVLVDLFDSDPYAEADRRRDNVTLREFLVRRAGDVGTELDDQPQLKAQLLDLLAGLLANLSLIEDAEPLALEALDIRRSLPMEKTELPVAESLATLGVIRHYQGRFVEAEDLHRRSLEIRQQRLPADDPLIVATLNDLSVSLHEQRSAHKQAQALALDQQVLELNISRFGPESLQAAQSYNNLGALYVQRGIDKDRNRAASLLRQALDIRRARLGIGHPNTATTAANLANLLHDMGQMDEAADLFKEAIESTRQAMGDQHTRLADVMYGSGFLLMDQQRFTDAIGRFGAALTVYQTALPADHPFTADAHFAMGQAEQASGRVAQASQNYLAALNIYRQDTKSLDSELRATLHYVRALVETGDQNSAVVFAQQALQRIDSTVDPSIRQELEDLAKRSVNGDGQP